MKSAHELKHQFCENSQVGLGGVVKRDVGFLDAAKEKLSKAKDAVGETFSKTKDAVGEGLTVAKETIEEKYDVSFDEKSELN